ncbi:hypothetical protein MHTCC0001_17980 [Flavobacteriaceae bacterium MHTCC 0001]
MMKKITSLLVLLLAYGFGYGQTILAKEDIAIVGVNTDNEDFTFVLRTDITTGTQIHFSDNEVNTSGTGLQDLNEGVILFTAAANYSCGTVLGYIQNGTEFTTVSGSFILNNTGDEVLAFQGFNLGTLSWTTFLHANVDATIILPAGFTAGDIVDGNRDNREYTGSTTNPSWPDLNAFANYDHQNNYSAVTLNTSAYTCNPCSGLTTTWNGTTWDNGAPGLTDETIIDGDYNSSVNGNITACSLTITTGNTLTVGNSSFVEIENDVTVDGNLIVETQGNFVQNDSGSSFTLNAGGLARVNKTTPPKAQWYYYTYWSSPVVGETVENAFPNAPVDRRFWFNAANYVDNNPAGGDNVDDNGDDWQIASGTMIPGVGYAITESKLHPLGAAGIGTFEGEFNNGDIDVTITSNAANTGTNWNFIGNPYPSAIDFDAFHSANSATVGGAAYFWAQGTPPSATAPGNEDLNFDFNDYAIYNGSGGSRSGGTTIIPDQYIPSGQGFFVAGTNGTATFTNAMRVADGTSNSQFFKTTNNKKVNSEKNRMWIDLTSGNGVFNQILMAYVNGATDANDGMYYDAPKLLSPGYASVLYSIINNDDTKYAIQGKNINSLDLDEVVKLGFGTNIDVATIYKLSISKLEGAFMQNNAIYIKDNLENKIHNLTDADYTFTSGVGEFNDRFEIVFTANALSNDAIELKNAVKIVQLDDEHMQFSSDRSSIKNIAIFDALGRTLYTLTADSNNKTFSVSNLKSAVYIANIELANGATISKKFIKN